MAPPAIRNLITKESLQGTIERDEISCHWFSDAVMIPQVGEALKESPALIQARNSLGRIIFTQQILYFVCVPALLLLFIYFRYPSLLWANAVVLILLYLLGRTKTKLIADIAWQWVDKEFPQEELSTLTYFQLTERLGKRHSIPTLVDTISRWDWVLRKWLLATYVICSLILFFNFLHFIAALLLVFFITSLFLRYASA